MSSLLYPYLKQVSIHYEEKIWPKRRKVALL